MVHRRLKIGLASLGILLCVAGALVAFGLLWLKRDPGERPTSVVSSGNDLPSLEPVTIALELAGTAEAPITYLTHAGDGSGRLFVVEKRGRVCILRGSELAPVPFLDIRRRVKSDGSEQGLLSLAFGGGRELVLCQLHLEAR